jgi:hypothetical protein
MRQVLALAVFMLATLVWAMAQQPQPSGGQATSPSSQTPGASQPPSSAPGSAGQGSAQSGAGSQGQTANQPITEGCLGGSDPNFTITDKAGTTYKLNLPPNANASTLTPHVGESVQVLGQVTSGGGAGKDSSIDVSKIGRGTGSCPGSSPKPPKP